MSTFLFSDAGFSPVQCGSGPLVLLNADLDPDPEDELNADQDPEPRLLGCTMFKMYAKPC